MTIFLMKNLTLCLFAMFFSLTVFSQNKPIPVSSKIEKVTVFTSGAQVLRKAKTTILKGKSTLVFNGISPNIDKQSIQVKGEGKFTILSVIHQSNFLYEQSRREEITLLEKQKRTAEDKRKIETKTLAVYQNEEDLLKKNQAIGGSNVGVKTSELKESADFHRSRMTEIFVKTLEISSKIDLIDSTLNKINKQLTALNQSKNNATSEVLVTVSANEEANAAFEVSYYVKNAGWFVNYDLRVKDVNSPFDLNMKANVFQSSGEDWKEVKLTISNADPSTNNIAPTLEAWGLGFNATRSTYERVNESQRQAINTYNPNKPVKGRLTDAEGSTLPGANIVVKGKTIGTHTDIDGNFTITLPSQENTLVISSIGYITKEVLVNSNDLNIKLEEDNINVSEVVVSGYSINRKRNKEKKAEEEKTIPLEITEKYQPTTISYEIEMLYTILNDGKSYVVDIKNESIPATYAYYAVPKLSSDAFLSAKVLDWQELNLFSGEVNLFLEGAYLGKSVLDIENADDTLDISLGVDKSIVIERKKLKEYSSKQFLSLYKTESRAFEINVRNNKQQSISIELLDQFPVSTNKEITIEEKECKDASIDEKTGIFTWKLDLPAKSARKLMFKYMVKYPKNKTLLLE